MKDLARCSGLQRWGATVRTTQLKLTVDNPVCQSIWRMAIEPPAASLPVTITGGAMVQLAPAHAGTLTGRQIKSGD
jgi:hypothetical protein